MDPTQERWSLRFYSPGHCRWFHTSFITEALLFLAFSRQGMQEAKNLLLALAEVFSRKQESMGVWAQAEQYLVSIRWPT